MRQTETQRERRRQRETETERQRQSETETEEAEEVELQKKRRKTAAVYQHLPDLFKGITRRKNEHKIHTIIKNKMTRANKQS